MSEQASLKFCKPYFARDQLGLLGEAVPAALRLETRDRSTTMSTLTDTRTPHHPASQNPVDAGGLTIDEVIPHLVGRTIDEVERELILHTLIRCCGSRTRSANILGISIRCMRNKIHEYEDIGISVRAPGEPRVGRPSFSRIAMRSRGR